MSLNFDALANASRLLMEADLQPVQGSRFQPTGFPHLGAAEYPSPDGGARMLLVESAQSMANRLEAVCLDGATLTEWVGPLIGLPMILVNDPSGKTFTSSLLEAHRLNSEYIARAKGFEPIKKEIGFRNDQYFCVRDQLAPVLLKYDPNSLLHGIFLEEIGGVIRLPRALSAFIEAADIQVAPSGGAKRGIEPSKKGGEGNVIYPRDEYVASKIIAYFNLDLAQLRAFGLGENVERLLSALALYKIRRFLETGLRLRTACDLDCRELRVTRPQAGFAVPSLVDLAEEMPRLISAVADEGRFADPRLTEITCKR